MVRVAAIRWKNAIHRGKNLDKTQCSEHQQPQRPKMWQQIMLSAAATSMIAVFTDRATLKTNMCNTFVHKNINAIQMLYYQEW